VFEKGWKDRRREGESRKWRIREKERKKERKKERGKKGKSSDKKHHHHQALCLVINKKLHKQSIIFMPYQMAN
jgi:hypothetical protein